MVHATQEQAGARGRTVEGASGRKGRRSSAEEPLGSCSANSNISMNLRTAFLAKELGLFVIDHELAHLTHHNHSADFYRLLEERQPEAKRLNAELKKAGATVPSWLS